MPNITFTDSSGEKFDLQSLKGKMVAINVWAFGCAPCIDEMPDLNKLVDQYSDSVMFISILGEGPITFSEGLYKELDKLDFKYTTLSTNKTMMDTYGLLMVFPTHLILDKDGKLLDLLLGPQVEKLECYIKNDVYEG